MSLCPCLSLAQGNGVKGDLETIVTRAQDKGEFLNESELSERKAFAETFVREIVVMPGKGLIRYNVPMPGDSHTPGADSEEVHLGGATSSGSATLNLLAARARTISLAGIPICFR